MKFFLLLVGIFIFTTFLNRTFAQKKDSTWIGNVNGTIRDSVYNFDLQSATLTLYRQSDTSLITYGLADNFGAFKLKNIPLNTPLQLVATYMGYKTHFVKLILTPEKKILELPTINMERTDTSTLEDVVVKSVVPIRMNGDTLEFNADAFHLDKNAVVDDLLRNIPNVTVWGDGSITVNGKEISSLKVDGKPYMGGDSKLALQNIAKDAVDKIQIYQVGRSETNLMDSTTEINIKIKEDKKHSEYGKAGIGIGTDHRYLGEASYNIIDRKTQIGISANANNINETPGSVMAELREGSFGGVNAVPEYQPNFSASGLNKYYGGGIMVQHDFQEQPTADNTQRFSGNYFVNKTIGDVSNRSNTLSLLSGDSSQNTFSNSKSYTNVLTHNLTGSFTSQKPKNSLSVNLNGSVAHNTTNTNSESDVMNQNDEIINKNGSMGDTKSNNQNIGVNISFDKRKSGWTSDYSKGFPQDYNINYSLNASKDNSTQSQKTIFESRLDPTQNRTVDRHYKKNASDLTHSISGTWGDFIPWIFGRRNFFGSTSLKFNNNFVYSTNKQNNNVTDLDTNTHSFIVNDYLTNNSQYSTVREEPALDFSKSFFKSSANRYSKSLTLNITPKWQFFHQKNSSSHVFQNFSKSYQNFIPTVNIMLSNYQFGAFSQSLNIQYSENVDVPTVDQMRPLVDSANITYLTLGNPNLKSSKTQNVNISFSHYNQSNGKNAMNFMLNLSAGKTNNAIIDSSFTDSIGRTTHAMINAAGNKYVGLNGDFNKSIKLSKKHQLQLQLNSNNRITKSPNIVNLVWNNSTNFNSSNSLSLYYVFSGIWAANAKQDYTYYKSKQSGLNNTSFSNKQLVTSFSTSVKPTTKWTIGTNINFNSAMSAAAPTSHYTIWNASTSYRFLQGNNLEFKFSALDLLHQNRTFNNMGTNNTITQTWSNTLQQYFMLSISYFPRKFGKKDKQSDIQNDVVY